MPDYFGIYPNYAFSPIIPKFVDSLPGLGSQNPNNRGQFIPIAVADKTTFPGSDYYQIGLRDYTQQLHSSLPATQLRGYYDLNPTADHTNHYLGPLIIAARNVPVRVKFTNNLATGAAGNLFLPVDTTYMGAGTGVGKDGVTPCTYTQNRAVLHLHGGVTPWISDGTPHQWITPAGESIPIPCRTGDSLQNVPDMRNPGAGSTTYYWTNQQSARLMFYHDHAYGLTRLNVYAGEASGYLLTDPQEESLINNGDLPNLGGNYRYGIPLIVQDKSFVPDSVNLAAEDPTWNWGPMGNLWFPHVYMPNQNPADPQGVNAMGRWDYGPWFWPPMNPASLMPQAQPILVSPATGTQPAVWAPGTPNPSGTPEAFVDTPLVNGAAYPYLSVPRQPVRFRILSVGNDRTFNLQLYYAADKTTGAVCKGTGLGGAPNCTEVSMAPAEPHTAASAPPLCTTATETSQSGLALGLTSNMATGLPTNAGATCWPTTWPADGRDGGVPDPATAGPPIIEIGTEGGLLPAPVVIPSTPVGFEYNRRSIVVLNISSHGLLLGPAERADIVVDFSQVPDGSTLILYNDAPAPVPALDSRLDFYTGDVDQSLATGNGTGGAPTTQPGFGPNTRTIMQFRVSGGTGTPFNLGALQAALPAAYAASQAAPVVPETAYNAAFGTAVGGDTYSRIQDTSLGFAPVGGAALGSITVTNGGSGYRSATPPAVVVAGGGPLTIALARAVVSNAGVVTGITLTNPGAGYTSLPVVTIAAPASGVQATASAALAGTTMPMGAKAIQELFTLDYGRMNATLGVELPYTNFSTQTTIPYGYIDPPTEIITDGVPQLWKITHNGVDTHFIHFHLFNVQVVNRVGWDGQIRAPDANELGWKETVRMNPLEDTVVAVNPIAPAVPFAVPDSTRLLDVTRPVGATNAAAMPGFTDIDPNNNPVTTVNAFTNFGWEYVWHCHLLGHEENDMMRPMVFTAKAQLISPTPGSALNSTSATFTWNYGGGVSATYLWVGTALGGNNLYSGAPGLATTTSVSGLPLNATLYVRLFSVINGATSFNDYTFANGTSVKAVMLNPAPGSLLPGASVTFVWTAGLGVSNYSLYVGTTQGSLDLVYYTATTAAPYTVTVLAPSGATLYVRLWSNVGGVWQYNDYTYTAANLPLATMASPTPGTVLSGPSVVFTWNGNAGISQYSLWIGTTPGSLNLAYYTATTADPYTATLPAPSGATIYVRLWSNIGGAWKYNDYTYTAATLTLATMASPTPGGVLSGPSVAFTWNGNAAISQYSLWIGTTPGSLNLAYYTSPTGASYTATLPAATGAPVYVRLWSLIGGAWMYNDYTYTN
jgi:FtsP/CotA-like multicopper oxidase with cupredoxin domain